MQCLVFLNSFVSKSVTYAALDNLCYPNPALNLGANLTNALTLANDVVINTSNGHRRLAQALIIVVTSVTPDATAALVASPMKRNRPITITTVGVTNAVDKSQLQLIATANGYNYNTSEFTNLVSLIPAMTPQECKPVPTLPGTGNSTCEHISSCNIISSYLTKCLC